MGGSFDARGDWSEDRGGGLVDEAEAPVGVVHDERMRDAVEHALRELLRRFRGRGPIRELLGGLLELLGERLRLLELLLQLHGLQLELVRELRVLRRCLSPPLAVPIRAAFVSSATAVDANRKTRERNQVFGTRRRELARRADEEVVDSEDRERRREDGRTEAAEPRRADDRGPEQHEDDALQDTTRAGSVTREREQRRADGDHVPHQRPAARAGTGTVTAWLAVAGLRAATGSSSWVFANVALDRQRPACSTSPTRHPASTRATTAVTLSEPPAASAMSMSDRHPASASDARARAPRRCCASDTCLVRPSVQSSSDVAALERNEVDGRRHVPRADRAREHVVQPGLLGLLLRHAVLRHEHLADGLIPRQPTKRLSTKMVDAAIADMNDVRARPDDHGERERRRRSAARSGDGTSRRDGRARGATAVSRCAGSPSSVIGAVAVVRIRRPRRGIRRSSRRRWRWRRGRRQLPPTPSATA